VTTSRTEHPALTIAPVPHCMKRQPRSAPLPALVVQTRLALRRLPQPKFACMNPLQYLQADSKKTLGNLIEIKTARRYVFPETRLRAGMGRITLFHYAFTRLTLVATLRRSYLRSGSSSLRTLLLPSLAPAAPFRNTGQRSVRSHPALTPPLRSRPAPLARPLVQLSRALAHSVSSAEIPLGPPLTPPAFSDSSP